MSGGIDARTMEKPRRFFGSARNAEHGGSLTIVATCLDRHRFADGRGDLPGVQGHREHGDRPLPRPLRAADLPDASTSPQSGTRKEEKLYSKDEVEKIYLLRRALASLSRHEAMQLLLSKLKQFKTNADFLANIQNVANGR